MGWKNYKPQESEYMKRLLSFTENLSRLRDAIVEQDIDRMKMQIEIMNRAVKHREAR